jgi:hypothetical protein
MSKLAAVAERIARTKRWLDQEVDRLAARLDQFEQRAPVVFQDAHRVLDEHQRDLEAAEELMRQWVVPSQQAAARPAKPRAPQQANGSPPRGQPRPPGEGVPVLLGAAHQLFNEQQRNVERLERALQTLTSEVPEPPTASAGAAPRVQPQPKSLDDDGSVAPDTRHLLDEAQYKDEVGLERALQTLATKMQAPEPTGTPSLLTRARIKPSGAEPPTPAEPPASVLEEAQQGQDEGMPAARKPGVVRVVA